MDDFYRLFMQELREMYDIERQFMKMMPDIIEATEYPKLKELLLAHYQEAKEQIKRLDMISIELNEDLTSGRSETMEAMMKEWRKIMKAHYTSETQDAAVLNVIQRIKHYKIAIYGSLRAFAKQLKLPKIEIWLKKTIAEEGLIDKKLSEIAKGNLFSNGLNAKACYRKCA